MLLPTSPLIFLAPVYYLSAPNPPWLPASRMPELDPGNLCPCQQVRAEALPLEDTGETQQSHTEERASRPAPRRGFPSPGTATDRTGVQASWWHWCLQQISPLPSAPLSLPGTSSSLLSQPNSLALDTTLAPRPAVFVFLQGPHPLLKVWVPSRGLQVCTPFLVYCRQPQGGGGGAVALCTC